MDKNQIRGAKGRGEWAGHHKAAVIKGLSVDVAVVRRRMVFLPGEISSWA